MKTLSIITGMAVIAAAQLTSCVSSKKYNELLLTSQTTERVHDRLLEEHGSLIKRHEALRREKQRLEEASSDALRKKQRELEERERSLEDLRAMQRAQRDAIASLRQEVCSALKCFTPDELQVEVREGKLYVSMSDQLLFPSGSDELNGRGAMAIEMLAAALAQSDLEIMVEGHTDNVPISNVRNRDNWDLSVHRATTVTRHMLAHGIDPRRIIAGGRGDHRPVADNAGPYGRSLNRRTEIVLAPRLERLWKLTEEKEERTASR